MYFMSFIPVIYGYDGCAHMNQLFNQDFGIPMTANDVLLAPPHMMVPPNYYPNGKMNAKQNHNQIGSTIKKDKTKFQINLDVHHFAPDEIDVKTIEGYVIVEGKHEEKRDEHGYISRCFNRRYMLPDAAKPELVECKLSSDGVLSIIAPKYSPEEQMERAVPIAQTGPIRTQPTEAAFNVPVKKD